mgnify:CR=1 FL=1
MPLSVFENVTGGISSSADVTDGEGLTKLEYSAIHIHAKRIARKNMAEPEISVKRAAELFDELDKLQTP